MRYKCVECGHSFDESEIEKWKESRGEFWGAPCSEIVTGCPLCRGNYEELCECALCNEEYFEDELCGGVCGDCLSKAKKDFNKCVEIGESNLEEVRLNSLLTTFFTEREINEILTKYIHDFGMEEKAASKFVESDEYWFCETLVEEVKNNEH